MIKIQKFNLLSSHYQARSLRRRHRALSRGAPAAARSLVRAQAARLPRDRPPAHEEGGASSVAASVAASEAEAGGGCQGKPRQGRIISGESAAGRRTTKQGGGGGGGWERDAETPAKAPGMSCSAQLLLFYQFVLTFESSICQIMTLALLMMTLYLVLVRNTLHQSEY